MVQLVAQPGFAKVAEILENCRLAANSFVRAGETISKTNIRSARILLCPCMVWSMRVDLSRQLEFLAEITISVYPDIVMWSTPANLYHQALHPVGGENGAHSGTD